MNSHQCECGSIIDDRFHRVFKTKSVENPRLDSYAFGSFLSISIFDLHPDHFVLIFSVSTIMLIFSFC